MQPGRSVPHRNSVKVQTANALQESNTKTFKCVTRFNKVLQFALIQVHWHEISLTSHLSTHLKKEPQNTAATIYTPVFISVTLFHNCNLNCLETQFISHLFQLYWCASFYFLREKTKKLPFLAVSKNFLPGWRISVFADPLAFCAITAGSKLPLLCIEFC